VQQGQGAGVEIAEGDGEVGSAAEEIAIHRETTPLSVVFSFLQAQKTAAKVSIKP